MRIEFNSFKIWGELSKIIIIITMKKKVNNPTIPNTKLQCGLIRPYFVLRNEINHFLKIAKVKVFVWTVMLIKSLFI